MQFISKDEVARLAPYGALIDALATGLREPITSPPRSHFNPNNDTSTVLIMPAWKPHHIMGTKIVSIWPSNNARGASAVSAVYVLTSCQDGSTLAVLDGTELTLRRTAATAALAARLLARPGSQRLLALGTGALSTPMALAHHSVFGLAEITVWGRDPDKARDLASAWTRLGLPARASTKLQQALASTDMVAVATTATTPFIPSAWVQAGTHLGLIGAFTSQMAEAEPGLLTRARLFADNRAAVLEKGGEVVQALQSGLISAQDVRAELTELLAMPPGVQGRQSEADITVFKSVGFAALDLVAAEHVWSGAAKGAAAVAERA